MDLYNGNKTNVNLCRSGVVAFRRSIFDSSYQIQRASEAKLLGVHIDSNLSWHTHVKAIVSKATQRLYFLKQLKHAGFPAPSCFTSIFQSSVLSWYMQSLFGITSSLKLRPIALYQFKNVCSIICIIYSFSNDIPYSHSLDRRYCQPIHSKKQTVFHSIVHPTSSLYSLLPPPRDPDLLARLRAPPNSPAYPHKLKISVLCIIRPFLLSNIDSIFTSSRLYTPSSIVTLISNIYVVV